MKRVMIIALYVIFIILLMSITLAPCVIAADVVVGPGVSIQAAIDTASNGDVIIIQPGTYYENIDFLGKAITIKSTDPNDPDVLAITIIDGNQAGSVVAFNNGEGNDTIINGVTLQNGKANYGGGIYCNGASPTISKCIITQNSAFGTPGMIRYKHYDDDADGGGIYCKASSPIITNCIIKNNMTNHSGAGICCDFSSSPNITHCIISENFCTQGEAEPNGGGICCWDNSSPTISNCTINDNSAAVGGGVYCYGDSIPIIIDCTITGNSCVSRGGGICCYNSRLSTPMAISNCTISENSAETGGGISCKYISPTITNCILTENLATTNGGGIYVDHCSPAITDCVIRGNSANRAGGGIFNDFFSSPIIANCIINNNTTNTSGGGIYCRDAPACVTNCTIYKNSASSGGDGIYCYKSSPYIVNSIIWGNELYSAPGSNPKLNYCNIQDGYPGLGNIDTDPLFANPNNGDFHLSNFSSCINQGHPRMFDSDTSRSDMGAYGGEGGLDPNSINITVAIDGSKNYTTIQDAIDYAVAGDTITVFPGEYKENLLIGRKNIALVSQNSTATTIIDGSHLGSVISLANVGTSALINGFTIQNGLADYVGGIYSYNSSYTLTNCLISKNSATGQNTSGGGIYSYNSCPVIINCTISGNKVDDINGSGGIYTDSYPTTTLTIVNSILWGNTALGNPSEISSGGYSSLNVTYSVIQGGGGGEGNIFTNPMFMDPNNGDYHLLPRSRCIDAGINSEVPAYLTKDFEGDQRILDGDNDGKATIDIGVDEYLFIDTDGDGMPDDWEEKYGLNSAVDDASGDLDGDGFTNFQEYLSGTKPNDLNSKPQYPTADAGADQIVNERATVTLNGAGSTDPDDGIVAYSWSQIDGIEVILSDAGTIQPMFIAPNAMPDGSTLTFQLTVIDNGGLPSTPDTCIVNVLWENDPPVANAGLDQMVDEGSVVTLNGSASNDPDDGIGTYSWSQLKGSPVTLSDAHVVHPTFTASNIGSSSQGVDLEFELSIKDKGNLYSTDTCIVHVTWKDGCCDSNCFISTVKFSDYFGHNI